MRRGGFIWSSLASDYRGSRAGEGCEGRVSLAGLPSDQWDKLLRGSV